MSRSVVVVSLRAGDWLEPCLRSVRDQVDQLVVVDNGSDGAEVSQLGRRFGALVVRSRTNQGFAGGVNEGLRRATGEVVGLLNDDAVAEPAWLDRSEPDLADDSVAAVVPKVLLDGWYGQLTADEEPWQAPGDARRLGRRLTSVRHGDREVLAGLIGPGVHRLESGTVEGHPSQWRWTRPGKPYFVPLAGPDADATVLLDGSEERALTAVCRLVNNTGLFLRADGYAGDRGLASPDDGRWEHAGPPFGAGGTALVTRSDTLRRVGLFAEPFFAYYEDADWSWRARRHGLEVAYVAGSSVSHRRSVTAAATLAADVRILGERNRLLCLARNAPWSVVASQVGRRVREGSDHGIRRGVLTRLPWALATRTGLSRSTGVTPAEVWDRWAGADVEWDDGPAEAGIHG